MKPSLLEKVKQDLRALRLKDMADILEVTLEAAHQEQQATSNSLTGWSRNNAEPWPKDLWIEE